MPRAAEGRPDFGPPVRGSLAAWRAAHPHAVVCNVRGRTDLTDADFAHLAGVRAVDMSECSQATITDAAFVHLRGVHTLHMTGCRQATITDAAFVHLRGVHTLDMSECRQDTITSAGLRAALGFEPGR